MILIPTTEATEGILRSLRPPLKTSEEPLINLSGKVLAEEVVSDRAYPPYDRCMMDGICFPHTHEGDVFQCAGTIHAGEGTNQLLGEDQVWRINTGAPVPEGCDIIVPVEELVIRGEVVTISSEYARVPGRYIHRKGSDVSEGATLLSKGSVLNSANLSIIASVGVGHVKVFSAPRVFVLTTGKEAVDPADTPTAYQIRRSHPTALGVALQRMGLTEVEFLHLPDDLESMVSALRGALRSADVIITCGAISKGTSDYLSTIFQDELGSPAFHGVSQRPGKPFAFWPSREGSAAVFALPGNAISTLVTFHRYVAPALFKLTGSKVPCVEVKEIEHELSDFHLTRFLPVELLGREKATLHNPQNSGDFSQLADTDGFVEIPLGTAPKSPTTVLYYPWL